MTRSLLAVMAALVLVTSSLAQVPQPAGPGPDQILVIGPFAMNLTIGEVHDRQTNLFYQVRLNPMERDRFVPRYRAWRGALDPKAQALTPTVEQILETIGGAGPGGAPVTGGLTPTDAGASEAILGLAG